MEQQTRKAHAARSGLLNTWAHADPPAADLPTRTGPRMRNTAPSDPTTSAITTAEGVRKTILAKTIATTRDLADHLDALGYTPDTTTLANLEQQPADNRPVHQPTMTNLLTVHRTMWQTLHDHTIHTDWDNALDLLHRFARRERTPTGQVTPGGQHNRLAVTIHRIAQHARSAIIQPDHPAAGTNRRSCDDRLDRGCQRFLPIDRHGRQCRSCEGEAYRRRQRQETP